MMRDEAGDKVRDKAHKIPNNVRQDIYTGLLLFQRITIY